MVVTANEAVEEVNSVCLLYRPTVQICDDAQCTETTGLWLAVKWNRDFSRT